MATVLAEVQLLFFAVAHPMKKILIPDGGNEETKKKILRVFPSKTTIGD